MNIRRLSMIGLFVLAASCTAPAPLPDTAIVHDLNAAWAEAFATGDGDRVAALYAEDAVVLPSGAPPLRGREEIARFWQGFMDSGAARVQLTTDEAMPAGASTIPERGHLAVFDANGATVGEGKYVVVWTLHGDRWLLTWDIWNEDERPAAPSE